MSLENISNQLREISAQLRAVRIQVVLLALKDAVNKHPRTIILENHLDQLLRQTPRVSWKIDDTVEEIETLIQIKPEHHQIAQKNNPM